MILNVRKAQDTDRGGFRVSLELAHFFKPAILRQQQKEVNSYILWNFFMLLTRRCVKNPRHFP